VRSGDWWHLTAKKRPILGTLLNINPAKDICYGDLDGVVVVVVVVVVWW
jgi:hypothetical protein